MSKNSEHLEEKEKGEDEEENLRIGIKKTKKNLGKKI